MTTATPQTPASAVKPADDDPCAGLSGEELIRCRIIYSDIEPIRAKLATLGEPRKAAAIVALDALKLSLK
jgi:hypothetical protein